MLVFAIIGWTQIQRLTRDEHGRVRDLIASCRRASVRNVADVNLNFLYYQSEIQLSRPNPGTAQRIRQLLDALSPSERRFILILEANGGGTSQRILQARADADFDAAYVKAQTIDYRDERIVHSVTALGRSPQPVNWVRSAHFSCNLQYR